MQIYKIIFALPFFTSSFAIINMLIEEELAKKLIYSVSAQVGVISTYLLIGYINNGNPPMYKSVIDHMVNPLPQVLMLTAIVVGITNFGVGASLLLRIKQKYGHTNSSRHYTSDTFDEVVQIPTQK